MITEEEIACLGKSINNCISKINTGTAFMKEQFPHASVTPKMHMPCGWLAGWVEAGIRVNGRARSIHAYFNGTDFVLK